MNMTSFLEGSTKDMTWKEVDEVWKKMEDNLPYVNVLARGPALDMIKELRAIAQRKHDEELKAGG